MALLLGSTCLVASLLTIPNRVGASANYFGHMAQQTTEVLPPESKIIFYGDSIGMELNWFLPRFIRERNGGFVYQRTFGATNACDWIDDAQVDRFLDIDIVIILFTGGNYVPCMQRNGHGLPRLLSIYKTVKDSKELAMLFPNAQVFFVGFARTLPDQQLIDQGKTALATIRNTLFKIAASERSNWHYIDGESVLYRNGRWTQKLPCDWFDQRACVNGKVVVRAPDGGHLCPGEGTIEGMATRCSVHSSGAIRLMRAIIQSITSTLSGSS